jgi:sodium-coupled neutral amino acid transporter 11
MSRDYRPLPAIGDTPESTAAHYNDQIEDEMSILDPLSLENDDTETALLQPEGQSSLRHAFFNMTNSIVGAGIVGIPMAFLNSGLLMGTLLMFILTVVNDWTLRLIIVNTKLSGTKTYTGFVTHSYGTWGKVVVLLSQGLFAVGGSIGFAIIIGDSIPHVLRPLVSDSIDTSPFLSFVLSRNFIVGVCICCICFPLSLIKDISLLARASGLALVSMTLIITIIVVKAPFVNASYKGDISYWDYFFNGSIFQGISVISFALVCHHNTTFIYDSIKIPTLDRFDRVIHISCALSGFVCALIGICGFLNFGDKTKGNILNNFPSNDWIINIARFCFGLNMITTLPLEIYVIREVLKDLYIIYNRRQMPSFEMERFSTTQHVIVTALLNILPLIVAMSTCNLGAVLEIVGATSGSLLAYILPPLCYNKMTKESKSMLQQLPYYACASFGFMVMILSSYQTIMQSINQPSAVNHCIE